MKHTKTCEILLQQGSRAGDDSQILLQALRDVITRNASNQKKYLILT